MASKNAQAVKAQFEAFNRNDLDAATTPYTAESVYTDRALGVASKGTDEIKEALGVWKTAMPDVTAQEIQLTDAGDTIVLQAVARGTNTGSFGPYPASGRRIDMPFCNVIRFDSKGRITSDELYYDQLSLLVQLGHAEAPAQ